MGEDDDTQDNPQGMPLPPLPPGISLPLPPPPPPAPLDVELEEKVITEEENSEDFTSNIQHTDEEDSPVTDFQSHWEKRKAADPNLSVGNRESMYGHIDRIATGEVGTLLDRFSNRFGSELDREIIVLRKKQQQEMREIKPTVELIHPPSEEFEELDEVEEDDTFDEVDYFPEFFSLINNLLGDVSKEQVIANFIASDSFPLFEKVGADPESTNDEERTEFFKMINDVLGKLPEDNQQVKDFVQSAEFSIFEKMGEIYGE
jgi:hypothetical protein